MIGSIGGPELLFLLLLALLLFGPRRLPQLGRMVGRALSEFRSASHDFRASLEHEVELEELRSTRSEIEEAGRDLRQATGAVDAPGAPVARGRGGAPAGPGAGDRPAVAGSGERPTGPGAGDPTAASTDPDADEPPRS